MSALREAVELHPRRRRGRGGTRRGPGPSDGRRDSSSVRRVPTTSSRAGSGPAARLRSREAVPASAQWRSSRNSTSGACSPSAASRSATAANSRKRSVSRSVGGGVGQAVDAVGEPGRERERGCAPCRATWACEHVDRCGGDEVAERIDERAVRRPQVLLAAAHRHRGAGVVPAADGVADDRRLADARLAAEEDDAALAAARSRRGRPRASSSSSAAAADEREVPRRPAGPAGAWPTPRAAPTRSRRRRRGRAGPSARRAPASSKPSAPRAAGEGRTTLGGEDLVAVGQRRTGAPPATTHSP